LLFLGHPKVLYMKKFPILLIFVFLAMLSMGACTSRSEKTISEIDALLGELKHEYAPDDRIELWEISASEAEGVIELKGEVASKEAFKAIVDVF
jgi:hypothetical protein